MKQEFIFKPDILILSGKEVFVIPCLAVVGAVSIMATIGYGVYRIGKKAYNHITHVKES